jgi:hypothetical protein
VDPIAAELLPEADDDEVEDELDVELELLEDDEDAGDDPTRLVAARNALDMLF